jgi:hypothetical protein
VQLFGTKGQRDKLKILPQDAGRDGLGQSVKIRDETGQSLFFCQNPGRYNHCFFPENGINVQMC